MKISEYAETIQEIVKSGSVTWLHVTENPLTTGVRNNRFMGSEALDSACLGQFLNQASSAWGQVPSGSGQHQAECPWPSPESKATVPWRFPLQLSVCWAYSSVLWPGYCLVWCGRGRGRPWWPAQPWSCLWVLGPLNARISMCPLVSDENRWHMCRHTHACTHTCTERFMFMGLCFEFLLLFC